MGPANAHGCARRRCWRHRVCRSGRRCRFGKDRARSAAGPRTARDADGVKRFVFNVPGAIGVIRLADVDDTVKVLRVNGASPGDPHYPLVMGES